MSTVPEVIAAVHMNLPTFAISVLTEPHWFKGSLDDMLKVRETVNKYSSIIQRPTTMQE